ncbi:hypothetical protein ABLV51_03695 [Klebsiella sp. GB_Kp051]|uniref:hypothetical protein n=1 Tax=Klebsiella sp. GB_Kp051 TaxID=3153402 RepID=UPI0032B6237F
MTDITELALITKIKNQLSNFDTVVLNEDEALALVEALERKEEQRANWFQMAQKLGGRLGCGRERNTELEEQNEYNRKRYQQLDLLIGKIFWLCRPQSSNGRPLAMLKMGWREGYTSVCKVFGVESFKVVFHSGE